MGNAVITSYDEATLTSYEEPPEDVSRRSRDNAIYPTQTEKTWESVIFNLLGSPSAERSTTQYTGTTTRRSSVEEDLSTTRGSTRATTIGAVTRTTTIAEASVPSVYDEASAMTDMAHDGNSLSVEAGTGAAGGGGGGGAPVAAIVPRKWTYSNQQHIRRTGSNLSTTSGGDRKVARAVAGGLRLRPGASGVAPAAATESTRQQQHSVASSSHSEGSPSRPIQLLSSFISNKSAAADGVPSAAVLDRPNVAPVDDPTSAPASPVDRDNVTYVKTISVNDPAAQDITSAVKTTSAPGATQVLTNASYAPTIESAAASVASATATHSAAASVADVSVAKSATTNAIKTVTAATVASTLDVVASKPADQPPQSPSAHSVVSALVSVFAPSRNASPAPSTMVLDMAPKSHHAVSNDPDGEVRPVGSDVELRPPTPPQDPPVTTGSLIRSPVNKDGEQQFIQTDENVDDDHNDAEQKLDLTQHPIQSSASMLSSYSEEIDLAFVEQFDALFEAFLSMNSQYRESPEVAALVDSLRVAKLQALLQASLNIENELLDLLPELHLRKQEMANDYHNLLIDASRKKAAREIHLQAELSTTLQTGRIRHAKLSWQFVAKCEQRAKKQQTMLRKFADEAAKGPVGNIDKLLSLLPDFLETQTIRDAVTAPPGTDLSEEQEKDLRQFQVDNAFLNAEVKVLEKKLAYVQATAKKHSWVDSVLLRMDLKRMKKLKHRYQKKLGVSF